MPNVFCPITSEIYVSFHVGEKQNPNLLKNVVRLSLKEEKSKKTNNPKLVTFKINLMDMKMEQVHFKDEVLHVLNSHFLN